MLPTPGQSGPGSDGNEGVLRIPQSSSITVVLTISLFNVIFRTLFERVLPFSRDAVGVFLQPQPTGLTTEFNIPILYSDYMSTSYFEIFKGLKVILFTNIYLSLHSEQLYEERNKSLKSKLSNSTVNLEWQVRLFCWGIVTPYHSVQHSRSTNVFEHTNGYDDTKGKRPTAAIAPCLINKSLSYKIYFWDTLDDSYFPQGGVGGIVFRTQSTCVTWQIISFEGVLDVGGCWVTPNAREVSILLTYFSLVWFLCLMAYQLLVGYLMPNLFS